MTLKRRVRRGNKTFPHELMVTPVICFDTVCFIVMDVGLDATDVTEFFLSITKSTIM